MRHSSPYNIQWDFELRAVVDLKLLSLLQSIVSQWNNLSFEDLGHVYVHIHTHSRRYEPLVMANRLTGGISTNQSYYLISIGFSFSFPVDESVADMQI
ncbi:uncharacterized protein LAJ45_10059 [Morchella importuna]|uniref:uncharacterized protein n=1 Tax=Morchella importuna TaxID=1174673 RepID=UPI001E8E00BF|nr:uncharacterized protein LAJ45_10059 [Morchella importuna]KAH8145917.1 hypothetical protein LAJ45_10059 [Morchella importuna]